jgi:malate dehydrogenase
MAFDLRSNAVSHIPQVTVVGAGGVGNALAKRILDNHLANVVLIDVVAGRPQGIALDLTQSGAVEGHIRQILGTNDYDDTANSDVVVVTAGLPRKPGMTRDDLAIVNGPIVVETVRQAIARSPKARLIIVTNPLDVMTYLAWQASDLPHQSVMGMAGVLDAARFRTFIAMALKVPVADVSALVLGGHGDLMVPLPNHATVSGIPLAELLDAATIQRLVQRTQQGGAEIVNLLKTGGAHYAPGAAVYAMVEAILGDLHRILPAAAYLTGEYQLHDLFIGVPCKICAQGIASVLEVSLDKAQQTALARSANAVQTQVKSAMKALVAPPVLANHGV